MKVFTFGAIIAAVLALFVVYRSLHSEAPPVVPRSDSQAIDEQVSQSPQLPAVKASPVDEVKNDPQNHDSLTADASPQVRSVIDAAKTGKHPERLSPMVPPQPFDQKKFEENPSAYLEVIEPGRAMQTAVATGPDSVHLSAVGPTRLRIAPRGTIALSVKGVPKAPVTFTSFSGGSFTESKLGSVTVRADDTGLATAHYHAGAGVVADVGIVAGSPLAVGTQNFVVTIASGALPRPPTAESKPSPKTVVDSVEAITGTP